MSTNKTYITMEEYNSIGREAAVQKPEVPDYPEIGVLGLQEKILDHYDLIDEISNYFEDPARSEDLLAKYDMSADELCIRKEKLIEELNKMKKTIGELNVRKMEINADMLKAKNEKTAIAKEILKKQSAIENTNKVMEEHENTEKNKTQREAGIEYYKARIDHLKAELIELGEKNNIQNARIEKDMEALRKLDHGKGH